MSTELKELLMKFNVKLRKFMDQQDWNDKVGRKNIASSSHLLHENRGELKRWDLI